MHGEEPYDDRPARAVAERDVWEAEQGTDVPDWEEGGLRSCRLTLKQRSGSKTVAGCALHGHHAHMTFTGIYATDLGSAHAGMSACPEERPTAWLPGRPSVLNSTRQDRKPQAA